ncbi:unnamed protein product [Spirodela intermedia]|uniref:Uncharacterized protein n=1 Tax=Spirodela intermedia TaxID=51605 RepID=A0A7I8JJS7_SPIIN|nr:unnamed protein product [Spirodela intermedia]CAA6670035.1 unnamed protein product [Spirodela intermedia]
MASAVMASCKTPSRIVLSPVASASKQPQQVSPNRFQQLKLASALPPAPARRQAAAVAAGLVAASWGPPLSPPSPRRSRRRRCSTSILTLPAIASEFLLLMVALDKIYFTPLGKFMDERDAAIRAKLGDVKDTSSEVKQMEEQAAAVIKAARAEISRWRREERVEAELAEALANLERQKEDTIKALDSQIAALSDEIVKKVIPAP